MTKLEQQLMVRYQAAFALHGYDGPELHKAAKLNLRAASAAAYSVVAGSQRKAKAWKDKELAAAHDAAIAQLRKMAQGRATR
jgi:hypothetical protein